MAKSQAKVAAFVVVLQSSLSIDDQKWEYHVPDLPSPSALNQAGAMKVFSFKTDTKQWNHSIVLQFQHVAPNRAIQSSPAEYVALASFEGFRSLRSSMQTKPAHPTGKLQPQLGREISDYMTRFLRAGVTLNGQHYNFFGHSNSQLKSRSCFMFGANRDEISKKVEALGDFSNMKTVGKKAKRIGLLFSTANVAMTVSPERCEDIADIETPDYIFTDGCGLIAPSLASELARRVRIVFRNSRYRPSVFQIRYRGYKGVVTVDTRLSKGKTLLKMRKSMKKFSGGEDHSFAVVDYSKPFVYGFLNDETTLLLRALGVSQDTLVAKQMEHMQLLSRATTDFKVAFHFLSYVNRPELAEKMLMNGIETMRPQINKLVNAEYSKMLNKRDEQKCRIFVQKSRLLFGVCDAWDVLKEGECAIKVTMEGDGLPYALKNIEASVIRNPCLHPGDWQKFRVVEKPELAHLVDCIVFSTCGRRPAADMMSGGDLDGDQFFVCWDPTLIPSVLAQPALYPGAKEPIRFNPISDDDRLVYFAKYTNASLGQVKKLYLDWARIHGPMSAPCQELNRLFSNSVDGNRINIPERLKSPPQPTEETPPFILDVLHEQAKEFIQETSSRHHEWDGFDIDAVDLLLSRENIAMSEFEFIRLAQRWCRRQEIPFEQLLHMFDLNILTEEEKAWVMGQMPSEFDLPSLVYNALCSSILINPHDLDHFHLNHFSIKWKCIYNSSTDRLATFLDAAASSLETFERKLIVFRPDERLTLAIYVPTKVESGRDILIDDTARLFAFPHSQGRENQSRLALPTKMTYRLYCDGNVFQLFENSRRNSWVFISRPGSNDTEYRNIADKGDQRRQRQSTINRGINFDVRASVALDKFSKGLQRHIGRVNRSKVSDAEIYIISNRDVKSMKSLDLWLDYIETREQLPLFPSEPKEYTLPRPRDVLSATDPPFLVQIIERRDVSALCALTSLEDFAKIFSTILRMDDRSLMLECFNFIFEKLAVIDVDKPELIYAMIDVLAHVPTLCISFGRLNLSHLPGDLAILMENSCVRILQAFILAANSIGELLITPLKWFLSRISSPVTLQDFANLIETICVTIHSPDMALDILLECLEPESERLLSGDPRIVRYFVRKLIAIALDYVEEAKENTRAYQKSLDVVFVSENDRSRQIIEITFRIDVPGRPLENASHVRLTAATLPKNVLVGKRYSIDALVVRSEPGCARLECFHPLPPYYQDCSWELEACGSFVTTKTMLDAVLSLCKGLDECCHIYGPILGLPYSASSSLVKAEGIEWEPTSTLNRSQNDAINAALDCPLLCLWGPPGTGKTETIVQMLCALQETYPQARILVTAPTHNAVDNVMRRYMDRIRKKPIRRAKPPYPIRVSTDVRKVADDLRKFTCDAAAGSEVHSNNRARDKAKKLIKQCDTAFTTCIGAGIGLLRSEAFQVVIVDEASQQTEPTSLVPLVKGCTKAVLVGDHVQLRPTVNQLALAVDFDISLFERLYIRSTASDAGLGHDEAQTGLPVFGVKTLMLNTQYRMHPEICEFCSREFYDASLQSGITGADRPLFSSRFPFPPSGVPLEHKRAVFVECASRESMGQKSKENTGQASLCKHICKLITTSNDKEENGLSPLPKNQSIAVLTPYSRQVELLRRVLSEFNDVEVSSIDGFQGREANVIVFVTVRCNEHRDIGFLKDLRRMNVALTRARTALIVIGNRTTLTEGEADPQSTTMWKRLIDGLASVTTESLKP